MGHVERDGMMSGAMNWGTRIIGTLVVLVLSAMALAKYIFTR
jgi:hypothetical protein